MEAVALPSFPPLQLTFEKALIEEKRPPKSKISTILTSVQPAESVEVTLNNPAHSPVAVLLVWVPGSSHR